jgi:hypothetical protein
MNNLRFICHHCGWLKGATGYKMETEQTRRKIGNIRENREIHGNYSYYYLIGFECFTGAFSISTG